MATAKLPLHPVLAVMPSIGTRELSTRAAQAKYPFLKDRTTKPCGCAGLPVDDGLLVLYHLMDTHVPAPNTKKWVTLGDWTKRQVSDWLWSTESRAPVSDGERAQRVRSEERKQRAQRIHEAHAAALVSLEQPSEADKIIVRGLGVRFD